MIQLFFCAKFMWSQQPGAASALPETQFSVNSLGKGLLGIHPRGQWGWSSGGGSLPQALGEQRELSSHWHPGPPVRCGGGVLLLLQLTIVQKGFGDHLPRGTWSGLGGSLWQFSCMSLKWKV